MRKSSGFTLIEIMVVVVILGILAAIIVPKIMNRPEQARRVKAIQDLASIQSALDLYKLDNGVYPSQDQGLQALVHKPTVSPVPRYWNGDGYLHTLPVDPWGQPYQYTNDQSSGAEKVFSFGPGGRDGNTIINRSDQSNTGTNADQAN